MVSADQLGGGGRKEQCVYTEGMMKLTRRPKRFPFVAAARELKMGEHAAKVEQQKSAIQVSPPCAVAR